MNLDFIVGVRTLRLEDTFNIKGKDMTTKNTHHEIYQVEISLGTDANNVAWRCQILGIPTESKVRGLLTELLKNMHVRITFSTGLPARDCLVYHQCLYLLERFGMPSLGLAHPCVDEELSSDPFIMGHISSMKIGSASEVIDNG